MNHISARDCEKIASALFDAVPVCRAYHNGPAFPLYRIAFPRWEAISASQLLHAVNELVVIEGDDYTDHSDIPDAVDALKWAAANWPDVQAWICGGIAQDTHEAACLHRVAPLFDD